MLFIVPIHLAWAGVACYSHADYAAETTHFVLDSDDHHHGHDHAAPKHHDDAADTEEHSAHCDACHAHCMTVVQNDFVWPSRIELWTEFHHVKLSAYTAPSEQPYRPQWRFHA